MQAAPKRADVLGTAKKALRALAVVTALLRAAAAASTGGCSATVSCKNMGTCQVNSGVCSCPLGYGCASSASRRRERAVPASALCTRGSASAACRPSLRPLFGPSYDDRRRLAVVSQGTALRGAPVASLPHHKRHNGAGPPRVDVLRELAVRAASAPGPCFGAPLCLLRSPWPRRSRFVRHTNPQGAPQLLLRPAVHDAPPVSGALRLRPPSTFLPLAFPRCKRRPGRCVPATHTPQGQYYEDRACFTWDGVPVEEQLSTYPQDAKRAAHFADYYKFRESRGEGKIPVEEYVERRKKHSHLVLHNINACPNQCSGEGNCLAQWEGAAPGCGCFFARTGDTCESDHKELGCYSNCSGARREGDGRAGPSASAAADGSGSSSSRCSRS